MQDGGFSIKIMANSFSWSSGTQPGGGVPSRHWPGWSTSHATRVERNRDIELLSLEDVVASLGRELLALLGSEQQLRDKVDAVMRIAMRKGQCNDSALDKLPDTDGMALVDRGIRFCERLVGAGAGRERAA